MQYKNKKPIIKTTILFVISILLVPFNLWAACSGSSPTWTTTPDYTSVSSCVSNAKSGDTINITAGSGAATWSGNLVITKGINLIGPGADKLTITSSYVGTDAYSPSGYLIAYNPTTPSLREPFRVSGFTINVANKSGCIILYNAKASTYSTVPNKIRIDHMKLLNSYPIPGIFVKGMWGVIDNNYVSGCYNTPKFGGNDPMWNGLDNFSYGTADNMYFEDNTVVLNVNAAGSSSGQAARYAIRYNTYLHQANYTLAPWFDVHGNFVSSGRCTQYGGMGSEIYGNKVDMTAYNKGVKLVDWRGGKNLAFFNKALTSGGYSAYSREEYDDAPCVTTASQPQHVSETYFWNNRRNTTLVPMSYANDTGVVHPIRDNSDVWQHSTLYNGTTQRGVYCGTTLPIICKAGDGAWITTQSCNSVNDENVGANPNIAISGTLYRCNASGQWVAYYKPYTYPHPLRTGTTTTTTSTTTTPTTTTPTTTTPTTPSTSTVGAPAAPKSLRIVN